MSQFRWKKYTLDELVHRHDAPELARFSARILIMFLFFMFLILVFLPWQQTSIGEGRVIAFSPDKRVQAIAAPFPGKIKKWFVREGQAIKKDEPIVEISDVDPLFLERLKIELDAAQKQLEAAKSVVKTSEYDYYRQHELYQKGISSRKDFEQAHIALKNAQSAEAGVLASLTQAQSRLSRQSNQVIRAPENGFVLKLKSGGANLIVNEGDQLAEFVPEGEDLATEVYISGMDLPLVRVGSLVRLQFEGWPAIQFSGWPSVAVGTFGGKVLTIDPTVGQDGRFRVIISRDQNQWPAYRFIRQGTRVNAWVLLNSVPLGFELWRQFNGFPATLTEEK